MKSASLSPLISIKRMPRSTYTLPPVSLSVVVAISQRVSADDSQLVPVFKRTRVCVVVASEYIQSSRPSPLISASIEFVMVGVVAGSCFGATKIVEVDESHPEPLPKYVPFEGRPLRCESSDSA